MKNDENSVNLSRRDFFKELGMIGGGFPRFPGCSPVVPTIRCRSQRRKCGSDLLVQVRADSTT
jgi:hypothetical protein